MLAHDIIKRPILSEKSYADISKKKYTFEVDISATKPQIKKAVEEIFKVKVLKVNTAVILGKIKRQGKHEGKTPDYKKAVVQLSAGSKSIEFFDSLQ